MTVKFLIFDLDGTLVNSAPDIAQALNKTLLEFGLSVVEETQVQEWVGKGIEVLLARALENALEDTDAIEKMKGKALQSIKHHYAQCCTDKTHLYPQVIETLDKLQEKELDFSIATNKPTAMIAPILNALNISSYFPFFVGGDDVVNKKPHPEMLLKCMSERGYKPEETMMIGDSSNDIQAARNAHIPVAAFTYGYNHGKPIASENPDFVLNSFSELLNIIK
ncbi:phosphoglycolate phosphatase [Paraneptunicella aestuarii]|uniref:phosphoglycolate phosphatase n=1 Tax=Paraneptunicella aestuarii TaxID=2831148 RepID=UPI001E4F037A|nr:phosphoglycolate phosphatase [Paraneptunicella aestuarii]UAA40230.1 phosphoglycolate phosphatase [Paraneptunicella aestuarii]